MRASPFSSSASIQVTVDDFKKINKALLRLLLALHECGGSLPTRKLYESANMSRAYGSKIIKKAVREGYIGRERVPKPQGESGNHQMINRLTTKARQLLKTLNLD